MGTKDRTGFSSRVYTFTKDKEIIKDLLEIEQDLFISRNEKAISGFKNKFKIVIS